MLNFVPIYTRIWSDKKFKKLSRDGKILFLYLFANESITLTGIYELDLDICRLKVSLNDSFDKTFTEVIDNNLIEWDKDKELIWIINRFKLIPTKSPKVIAGAVKELENINHQFKNKFIEKYKSYIKNELYRLKEYEQKPNEFLEPEQINNLVKFYTSKNSLKKFLINRGCTEAKIDDVIKTILPNLK